MYHCRNPSQCHTSHYEYVYSFTSPSVSFSSTRLVHSQGPHTRATVTDQATTQIWAHMSFAQQLASSKVTCSCFPHVACVNIPGFKLM
jgi:hypothetical protein